MSGITTLDGPTVVAMLRAAAGTVIANEPILTKADQAIGDGNHGIGMARGFKAALAALDKLGEGSSPKAAFSTVGMAVLSSAGGASGAIFGTFFQGVGKTLGAERVDAKALAGAVRAGAEAVMTRGKAKAGDKTMLDALLPAADALFGAGGRGPSSSSGGGSGGRSRGDSRYAGDHGPGPQPR